MCGLSTCKSNCLVAMTLSNLIFNVIEVVLYRISSCSFPGSFLDITPVCSVIIALLYAAANCSVWFTVMFSFDRFVAICCQKLKMKYCTEKTATVVLSTTCILNWLKCIPIYFIFQPRVIIDNAPWFCIVTPGYYIDPAWVAFDWLDKISTPLFPYILILLLNALTVRCILVSSRVRWVRTRGRITVTQRWRAEGNL